MWTDAQKTVINAAHASTLANLAVDLSGRNANEALDDPIAIAAAQKAAADGVLVKRWMAPVGVSGAVGGMCHSLSPVVPRQCRPPEGDDREC